MSFIEEQINFISNENVLRSCIQTWGLYPIALNDYHRLPLNLNILVF